MPDNKSMATIRAASRNTYRTGILTDWLSRGGALYKPEQTQHGRLIVEQITLRQTRIGSAFGSQCYLELVTVLREWPDGRISLPHKLR